MMGGWVRIRRDIGGVDMVERRGVAKSWGKLHERIGEQSNEER